jgi:DNA repair protein RadA
MVTATGDEVVRKAASFRFFSSGSKTLDSLLDGGFREGKVVEFYGKSNSGKTQLAMQAALYAAREGPRVLFVDTEGSFRPERLEAMARARGWKTEGLLDRVIYIRTDSSSEQMEVVRMMAMRNTTASCRMVVVDTLTRNFSVELPGRSNLASRQGGLNVHLSEIARDAFLNSRAYVLTNRVTFGAAQDVGIGGKTVDQLLHMSVRLDRQGAQLKGTLASGASAIANFGETGID